MTFTIEKEAVQIGANGKIENMIHSLSELIDQELDAGTPVLLKEDNGVPTHVVSKKGEEYFATLL
jgi:hypothetical protein